MDHKVHIDKIKNTELIKAPFELLYIENFLEEETFNDLINDSEINVSDKTYKDDVLINELVRKNYEIIPFPGTTANKDDYIRWRNSEKNKNDGLCEGIGLTFRLKESKSKCVSNVLNFFKSEEFFDTLNEKFKSNWNKEKYYYDGGIQKYLDGYEISPHPDIRKKYLTWMLNINPFENSENEDIHTQYLNTNKEKKYIDLFFKYNMSIDRCWIPWDWCESVFEQKKNNSLVVFSPSFDTYHAIKCNYNHFKGQRTQIYGNLWYEKDLKYPLFNWQKLDILKGLEDQVEIKNQRSKKFL